MPSPRTRRAALRLGVAALGLTGGCLGDGRPSGAERTAATRTTRSTTEGTFPPPPPTTAAPQDPRPLPVGTDWPRAGYDDANTGSPDATAVPDDATTYWHFFTQATPPVVADGTAYTVEYGRDRHLVARDAATGRLRWQTTFTGGDAGVPTVRGDTLYLQTYSTMFAFDRATGRKRWSANVGRGPPGAPVVRAGVVSLCNGSFERWPAAAFAFDADSGDRRWRVELDGDLRGSLAVVGDGADGDTDGTGTTAFVGTDAGTLYALALDDGSERWTADVDPVTATAAVADGTVFVTSESGTLYAVRTDDGARRWTAAVGAVDRGSSPAVAADTVYVGSETGLHAVATDDGSERWSADIPSATAPAVGSDAVYVGSADFDDRGVYAVSREDGERRWSRRTDRQGISDTVQGGVRGQPTLVAGGVYVLAADGLHAFGRPR